MLIKLVQTVNREDLMQKQILELIQNLIDPEPIQKDSMTLRIKANTLVENLIRS